MNIPNKSSFQSKRKIKKGTSLKRFKAQKRRREFLLPSLSQVPTLAGHHRAKRESTFRMFRRQFMLGVITF